MDLLENWKDQMIAQVKGERNHPSIMIWSIENEYLYINCINLYGGLMDQFEAEVKKVSDVNGTVMCNSLAGRGLGVVCVLDDHCGMVAERIFHARVAWARRGYENSCRIRQSGKPIGRYR